MLPPGRSSVSPAGGTAPTAQKAPELADALGVWQAGGEQPTGRDRGDPGGGQARLEGGPFVIRTTPNPLTTGQRGREKAALEWSRNRITEVRSLWRLFEEQAERNQVNKQICLRDRSVPGRQPWKGFSLLSCR